jgi:hypothetical protein
MGQLDLRIRDLKTGETLNATFESEEDAHTWLADRPEFTEVLGVATHGLSTEAYASLRAAVRPLDAEEQALQRKVAAEAEAAERVRLEVEMHKIAMRHADPHRPMLINWTYDHGMHVGDPLDPREVTEAAREAVTAWVRERDEWVKDKGQMVGEANVTVWPGPLPAGQTERVHRGGIFYPTTAPSTAFEPKSSPAKSG